MLRLVEKQNKQKIRSVNSKSRTRHNFVSAEQTDGHLTSTLVTTDSPVSRAAVPPSRPPEKEGVVVQPTGKGRSGRH